jgi:hypothetical protein
MAIDLQFEKPRRAACSGSVGVVSMERHYTPAEISEMWNLSPDTVRKLFEQEPGVLLIRNEESKYSKRRYTTLRIPQSVLERVHKRLSKV